MYEREAPVQFTIQGCSIMVACCAAALHECRALGEYLAQDFWLKIQEKKKIYIYQELETLHSVPVRDVIINSVSGLLPASLGALMWVTSIILSICLPALHTPTFLLPFLRVRFAAVHELIDLFLFFSRISISNWSACSRLINRLPLYWFCLFLQNMLL